MNSDVEASDIRTYVFDASVLVSRTRISEAGFETARALLTRLVGIGARLYVPTIAIAEVAAAVRRGTGDAHWSIQTVMKLKRLPRLHVVPVTVGMGDLAAEIAARHAIRGCDAVYVALARTLGATLVSEDREQIERSPVVVIARTPTQVLVELTDP